jgi:hypothetical protein
MNKVTKPNLSKGQSGGSLLGLTLDGSRLEGTVVRRTNGSVEIKKTFSFSLSLDPLTADPALVGREIQKQLETAGIRERRCVVCLPLSWALTLNTKLPDLPEADLESFIQLESERGFPQGLDAFMLAQSRYRTPAGEAYATMIAIPREHITRLEAVLKAARLRPVSFSLGIAALQRPDEPLSDGVLALAPSEKSVGLQVSCGGGVAVLRKVEGNFDLEGGEQQLQAEQVARETRITLGQLPPDLREAVKRLRVFGRSDAAEQLAEQLRPRVEPLGIKVELVRDYSPGEFGVHFPAGTAVSPAMSLAVRHLIGQGTAFEFLPPKISKWKQLTARYSTGPLATAGAAAAAVALVVVLAFLVQQAFIWHWQSKWNAMAKRVTELNDIQDKKIRKYRPWFDDSVRSLSILRRVTEAFPPNGSIAAKVFQIRESTDNREPVTLVNCSGTALNNQALLLMKMNLDAKKEVSNVHIETKGTPPMMEFTLNFYWKRRGGQ